MASLLSRALDLAFAAHAAADVAHERVSAGLATAAAWWIRTHVLDSEQARLDLDAVLAGDVDRQVHDAALDSWEAGFQRAIFSLRAAVEADRALARLYPGAAEVVLALLDELVATAVPEPLEHAVHDVAERLKSVDESISAASTLSSR